MTRSFLTPSPEPETLPMRVKHKVYAIFCILKVVLKIMSDPYYRLSGKLFISTISLPGHIDHYC